MNEVIHHGGRIKIQALSFDNGCTVEAHHHRRGQLIYAASGVMEVNAGNTLWRVPPQRAVWMPPQIIHSMRAHGTVALRTAYLPPEALSGQFPQTPCLIAVSPLLRELILRGIALSSTASHSGLRAQICALIINELALLLEESRHAPGRSLPLPSGENKPLARICTAIMADPGHPWGLEDWARQVGASKRTLARHFQSEFGMSFLCWRQQVRMVAALSRLDLGDPVTVIASDLGYKTPAAFSLMFRKATGLTPSRYVTKTCAHACETEQDECNPDVGIYPADHNGVH